MRSPDALGAHPPPPLARGVCVTHRIPCLPPARRRHLGGSVVRAGEKRARGVGLGWRPPEGREVACLSLGYRHLATPPLSLLLLRPICLRHSPVLLGPISL